MNILLVLAASLTDPLRRNDPFMPLSLPLLAATAPGHRYTLVDLLWDDDVDTAMDVDLVGISMRLTGENRAYAIADAFRRRGVKVVIGGPQASAVPMRVREHADAVAVGEGEPLWPTIVQDVARGALKDFYVCSPVPFLPPEHAGVGDGFPVETLAGAEVDSGASKSAPAPFTVHQVDGYADLSALPVARRDLYRRSYRFDTVFAVRGCPIDCDFCAVPTLFGRRFRTRPAEAVAAEIDTFRNYYYLLDDTVFGKPSTYDYYLDLYARIARLKKRRFWCGQGNLDAAGDEKGREVIRAAVRAGLLYVMVGMESISPATLAASGAIRKMGVHGGEDPVRRMAENIRWLQGQGLVVSGWFVVGYESDTLESWDATLAFCRENHVIPVISPIKALPGTRLYDRLQAEGRLDDTRFLNLRHPTMRDADVLAAWQRVAREGYSTKAIWDRTRFYARCFQDPERGDRIHKTIFTWILQTKMKKGMIHDEVFDPGDAPR